MNGSEPRIRRAAVRRAVMMSEPVANSGAGPATAKKKAGVGVLLAALLIAVTPANSRAKGIERRGSFISSPIKDAVSQPPRAKVSTDQKMMSFKCMLGVIECMVNGVADP